MIDFRNLNARLDASEVLRDLDLDCRAERYGVWRGRCPVHRSSGRPSRSLKVDLALRRCYCHNCHWTGDLIDLCAVVWNLSLCDTAERLCRIYGIVPAQR